MTDTVLKIENISKQYRLGEIGTGMFSHDLHRWWMKTRGKQDPYSKLVGTDGNSAKSIQDKIWALKDITLDIKQGEILGIIGNNGAGKSTLLKIISRITSPTTGSVKAKGKIASLLEVGTGMHPELTARENIYLNGVIMGMRQQTITHRFDEIVSFAGIDDFVDTPIKRYSSGMHVRLGFAVAAFLEPEILIVDEVLAVGDVEFQRKCIGKMDDMVHQGRTVLFVSHNMAAIESLCSRGIVLDRGELSYSGSTRDAIAYYISKNAQIAGQGSSDFSDPELWRKGPQAHACLKKIALFNSSGKNADVLRMGESATFHIDIEFKSTGSNFEVGISICNLRDVQLHFFISNWEGLDYIASKGLKTIEVNIPKIVLYPGEYKINVWVKRQGEAYDDAVHGALKMRVDEAQITPHFAYFSRYSQNTQVYIPSSWEIINS